MKQQEQGNYIYSQLTILLVARQRPGSKSFLQKENQVLGSDQFHTILQCPRRFYEDLVFHTFLYLPSFYKYAW